MTEGLKGCSRFDDRTGPAKSGPWEPLNPNATGSPWCLLLGGAAAAQPAPEHPLDQAQAPSPKPVSSPSTFIGKHCPPFCPQVQSGGTPHQEVGWS